MNAIQTATRADIMPAADLRQSLFYDFIEYIDRGEKTTRTYITNLRQFIAWMYYTETRRPQRQDIILYRQYLTAEHDAIKWDPAAPAGWRYRTDQNGTPIKQICKATTAKQYLQTVRQFFSWTAANGYYPNIAANIHTPPIRQNAHKKDALTAADVLTIENSIAENAAAKAAEAASKAKDTAGRIQRAAEQGKRLNAIYLLAVTAGLRTIEISRANIKDIGLQNGRAYIYVWGKGHAEADYKKPIALEVYNAICDYISSRSDKPTGSAPLFVATGNRSGGKRLAPTTISTMLKKALQQAGYHSDRITAHSLRHTAGNTVMELTGDNLYITQQYMRHTNPNTTEIYLHRNTEEQQAELAQELYNRYHSTQVSDDRAKLESLIKEMTPGQLQKLAGIAENMET